MKKLLTTSAMVVALSAPAIAQTTVTGNLDIAYKAFSNDTAATKINSGRGFGKEAQINIQNKGKLNIAGWDYAAGFALEDDGNQAGSYFNENTFIDFINGNTTITIGQDHIQNNDQTTATFVGLIAEDLANGSGTDIFLSEVGANPKESFGVGIMQTIPGFGRVSALYVPSNSNGGAGTQATAARPGLYGADDSFVESDGESAYELGFQGDLGVKGLNVIAFMNKEKATTGYKATDGQVTTDTKGNVYGLSYNMGQITAGYTYKKSERGFATAANGKEIKQDEFGLAYAVSPTLTVAANYTKADGNGTTLSADAKMKSIAVGYNLGPVAVSAQAAQLENYTGASGVDADVLYLRASTKF
jgi:hypothetical protein